MGAIRDTVHFTGLSADVFYPPAGSISDTAVAANAGVDDSKLKRRMTFAHSQTGTVAAAVQYCRIVEASGTVLSVEAAITETIATGNDRVVSVDVKKSTGGGAFNSILAATIDFDDASVLLDVSEATITSPNVVDGDVLEIVVTVAGVNANQALGLLVNLTLREAAQ